MTYRLSANEALERLALRNDLPQEIRDDLRIVMLANGELERDIDEAYKQIETAMYPDPLWLTELKAATGTNSLIMAIITVKDWAKERAAAASGQEPKGGEDA